MSPIKNQYGYASCVPFGILAALEYKGQTVYSEEFNWWYSKETEGSGGDKNAGIRLSTALKILSERGDCSEQKCPYPNNPIPPPNFQQPTSDADNEASHSQVKGISYKFVDPTKDITAVKTLLSAGQPVIIAFPMFGDQDYQNKYIYEEDTKKDGHMKMPPAPVPGMTDGHVVTLVGYNDNDPKGGGYFKFKNSWGADKGDHGWYYMPYEFFETYALNTLYFPDQKPSGTTAVDLRGKFTFVEGE